MAKSIRDGVIEATIARRRSCAARWLTSPAPREPQLAFDQRIKFCLNMHNQSVKDMRSPAQLRISSRPRSAASEQQDLELVNEMAEEDEEDGFLRSSPSEDCFHLKRSSPRGHGLS